MTDTINIVAEQAINTIANPINWWKWIAIIEFGILLLVLVASLRKKNPKIQEFKDNAMKGETDFGNTMTSIFHSQKLYNTLKIVCHPDRFAPDVEKQQTADKLFQELTENKTNYKKLLEIKDLAENELGIKIKN